MISRALCSRVCSALGLVVVLASCGSTSVSLDYQPALGQAMPGPAVLAPGRFADLRDDGDYILGEVRTPIGTPLERLTSRVPVSEVVRNAFAHGLRARGMFSTPDGTRFILTGEILDLQCDQVVRPAAYARVRVNVVHAGSGQIVHSRIYSGERTGSAYLPGSGDPVPRLRELTSRALQDVVDRALDDPSLRSRLLPAPTSYRSNTL
ncbi:MAG: hypothetical protein ACOYMN_07790 [Roseimicrobium sp.]